MSNLRYPTGIDLIDELTEFHAERLEAPIPALRDKPCLAENWWVEDRLAEGRKFPLRNFTDERALRFCWRRAHQDNVARLWRDGRFMRGEPADLLLHQMTELIPAMFAAAKDIFEAQRIEAGTGETVKQGSTRSARAGSRSDAPKDRQPGATDNG